MKYYLFVTLLFLGTLYMLPAAQSDSDRPVSPGSFNVQTGRPLFRGLFEKSNFAPSSGVKNSLARPELFSAGKKEKDKKINKPTWEKLVPLKKELFWLAFGFTWGSIAVMGGIAGFAYGCYYFGNDVIKRLADIDDSTNTTQLSADLNAFFSFSVVTAALSSLLLFCLLPAAIVCWIFYGFARKADKNKTPLFERKKEKKKNALKVTPLPGGIAFTIVL